MIPNASAKNKSSGPSIPDAQRRRRAEARLKRGPVKRRRQDLGEAGEEDPRRLIHELQIHQIELEMQNAELEEARNRSEALLEKYTDLYDFAPVGYFSLDEMGRIVEVNLTGASVLGLERSRLLRRSLSSFVAPEAQASFSAFLVQVCAGTERQSCEARMTRPDGETFWAGIHSSPGLPMEGAAGSCRIAVTDITSRKTAEETQRNLDILTASNRKLEEEIVRRQKSELALRRSERGQRCSLTESRLMQAQLRLLSRQVLKAQEEERRRVSRELHDVIAQTLTGIHLRLANLSRETGRSAKDFTRSLAQTQRLVLRSVHIVQEFARELRPAVLDDLGLVPALHSFMKSFAERTGVRTGLTAYAEVDELDTDRRTVLFRVAQEALKNVGRHAEASRVEVVIERTPHGVRMKVKDDGKSFSSGDVLRAAGKHLGLIGMRERLEMVGGHLSIESTPGSGTVITAHLPLRKPRGKGPTPLAAVAGSEAIRAAADLFLPDSVPVPHRKSTRSRSRSQS